MLYTYKHTKTLICDQTKYLNVTSRDFIGFLLKKPLSLISLLQEYSHTWRNNFWARISFGFTKVT
jgi:hypothetical protein